MTTLKDIAERCGVSISAVSLAMHQPHRISRTQKEKILKVAHELGYFQKKHPTIEKVLVIADNFHDCYFGEYYNKVIYGILESLYSEKIVIQILSSFSVEYSEVYDNNGIIFIGKVPDVFIAKAQEFRLPFVLCGHPRPGYYSLRFDIERGVHELIDYVVSCGHKKIGMIIPESDKTDVITNTIQAAYQETLKYQKIPYREQLVATANFSNLQTVEIALNKLLKAKPAPTAIFCTSDHFAYIAYRILKKWNIRIPLDVSIVGFDGINVPLHLETPQPILTTVATDQVELGRESVALLKKIILTPNDKPIQQILPIHLRIGDSVQRLR
jgi:DNA-binding LacI/PurR family transcriptional regulator